MQFEAYLQELGNKELTSERIGGTLKHVTGNPASYQSMFESGKVDLAAVPEPWASILVENGANVVVSTEEIAYGETLPNTVFVARGQLIEENKELVEKLMQAHKKSVDFINNNPDEARKIAVNSIKEITNQEMDEEIVKKAMDRITYTTEVDEQVLKDFAESSYELKFLKEKPSFDGLVETVLAK